MTACAECVMRSLLQSEAIGFAERNLMTPDRARRLMNADEATILRTLRDEIPGAERRMRAAVESLLGGDSDEAAWLVCAHESAYPEGLTRLDDRPTVVYGRGRKELLGGLKASHPGIAIVGARRASSYGRDVAHSFGRELAAAGLTIVSGMALGVDGAAHRGALAVGGRTIAVLAGGPDRPYPPSHRLLYEQIVEQGAVVSERPPGSRARRWGFPARNRLIAALARATVFVEGTSTSGALHTVDFAETFGQDPLAVPGPITSPLSEGPNRLLVEDGARPVIDARSVLDAVFGPGTLDGAPCSTDPDPAAPGAGESHLDADADLGVNAKKVLKWIRAGESSPSAIRASAPELSQRDISIALGELEMSGRVERLATGEYRVVDLGARGGSR